MKKEAGQIVIFDKNIREIVIEHYNVKYDIIIVDSLIKGDVVARKNVIGGEIKASMNFELHREGK